MSRARMRSLRSPALLSWVHELRCTDDGEGVDADVIDRRLGALGVEPPTAGQRGLFGRGLRDVWLAQGAGRIEGIRGGRLVESWFFPAPGDEPYAFAHVRDRVATAPDLSALGVTVSGTRVTVPLSAARLPAAARLRALVSQLVQLRPILEDPTRAILLEQPGQTPALVTYPAPEPDVERPPCCLTVTCRSPRRSAPESPCVARRSRSRRASRARPGGAGWSSAPVAPRTRRPLPVSRDDRVPDTSMARWSAMRSSSCSATRSIGRAPSSSSKSTARGSTSTIRSSSDCTPRWSAVLRPIVAAEERRAGAHLIGAARAVTARDQVGLRALNDLLKAAFDQPGSAGAQPGTAGQSKPPTQPADSALGAEDDRVSDEFEREPPAPSALVAQPLWFKQSPVRLRPRRERAVHPVRRPGERSPRDHRRDRGRPRAIADASHARSPGAGRARLQHPPSRYPRQGHGRARLSARCSGGRG